MNKRPLIISNLNKIHFHSSNSEKTLHMWSSKIDRLQSIRALHIKTHKYIRMNSFAVSKQQQQQSSNVQCSTINVKFKSFLTVSIQFPLIIHRAKFTFQYNFRVQKVQMARNFAKFLTDKVAVITASTDGYVIDIVDIIGVTYWNFISIFSYETVVLDLQLLKDLHPKVLRWSSVVENQRM